MTDGLTEKQLAVLEYIKKYILKKSYPPSVREICEAVGLQSTSSVHAHLNSLEKKGYIKRDPAKPRTIEILDEEFSPTQREIVNVPLLGRVAAGQPIYAEENVQDYFPIPADMLPNNDIFMLKVRGESMINVGIYDGDQIIVERRRTASNGEIVVAFTPENEGATVKRFYKENGHFRLQPENDFMDPIITDDVIVLGKVIGLFRMM